METGLDLVDVPARQRAAALEAWITTQPGLRSEDRALAAAETLVAELGALLDAAERDAFLAAPGLRWPLATLADASRGSTAATLWAWAAISAGIEGELADVAPELAVRAILADPGLPLAWETFEDAVRAYVPPDLFGRVQEWRADAERAPIAARATGGVRGGSRGVARRGPAPVRAVRAGRAVASGLHNPPSSSATGRRRPHPGVRRAKPRALSDTSLRSPPVA